MSDNPFSLEALLNSLRIPAYFYLNAQTSDDDFANAFKAQAELALAALRQLVKQEEQLSDELIGDCLWTCILYLGEEPWSNASLKELAHGVITNLHEAQPRFRDIETLVETFVLNIMNKYIKPAFMRYSSEMNVGNGKSKTSIRTTTRPSIARKYELPAEDTSWRVDIEPAARVIEWMVCRMRPPAINNMIQFLIPPTLTLLDNFDVTLKTRGITILDQILRKVNPTIIQRTGLGNVFYEAISACLMYQSEVSHAQFLRPSYSAMLNLVSVAESRGSEAWFSKHEKILRSHVLRGLVMAGDIIVIRRVLLEQIPVLVEYLDIVAVKYLKELVDAQCKTLEIPLDIPGNDEIVEMHLSAAEGLQTTIRICWPRIPPYEGKILKAVVTSWKELYHFEADRDASMTINDLKNKLRNVCKLLKSTCTPNTTITKDFDALRRLDENVFGPLLDGI
ncbi:1622_t:CDS:2 [Paraglomus brasilianum]|uniref:1622_t:CDS:1 n=1 Tax=Paraglomus brasilianum TaxID=144538 RepID=A0A9N8ZUQ7_9GLOM|nr:1622_t:CDS:2 [Paraglomus brasilianum]